MSGVINNHQSGSVDSACAWCLLEFIFSVNSRTVIISITLSPIIMSIMPAINSDLSEIEQKQLHYIRSTKLCDSILGKHSTNG